MDLINIVKLFYDKSGLEIGGPSGIFKDEGILPIYRAVKSLDGVNFSRNTLWEHGLEEGQTYKFRANCVGNQFICEVTELCKAKFVDDYDFVISSNCLEHVANPLDAMRRCLGVLKDGGLLLLVLPRKESNFDHKRSSTPFQHVLNDWISCVGEDDLTHLDEILEKHDLSLDPPAGDKENFKKRSLDNFKNRALHHHVFDLNVLYSMYKFFGIEEIAAVETESEYIIVGRKGNQ